MHVKIQILNTKKSFLDQFQIMIRKMNFICLGYFYSYSFELNPDWTSTFSKQDEILRYMEYVSDKHGITQHVEFNKKVESMTWNKATHKWDVKLNNGEVNDIMVS